MTEDDATRAPVPDPEPGAAPTEPPKTDPQTTEPPKTEPPKTEPGPLTLLYLDVDDEITSAAARIRGAAADDVAIVLPYGSRLATSRINFRLLAREAAERGKRIEVICADASARSLAAAAGLPVHPSVALFEARRNGTADAAAPGDEGAESADDPGTSDGRGGVAGRAAAAALAAIGRTTPGDDAEDTRTRVLATPRRRTAKVPLVGPARPPMRTGVAIGLGIAVIAAVIAGGLLALEYLPSATITLHPRSEDLGPFDLTVEARADAPEPDPENLVIPARRFDFVLEASQTFPATGVKVTDTKATGTVRFSNFDTGSANRIDAGSIVSTESGIEFVTQATVTLPNATIQFPFTIVPSTSSVDVVAVEAGPGGNVGNNTIVVLPKGENRRLLQVTNVDATSGGAHEESPQVSQDDVDAAVAAIDAALIAELDRQVTERAGVPAEVTLFAQTRLVGESRFDVDPATLVGTEAADFSLAADADGTALGVDPEPARAVAEAELRSRVPAGWTIQPGSIEIDVGPPTVLGELVTYPVEVGATQVRDVDADTLAVELQGLLIPEARAKLNDLGDVVIDVWPEWVTRIPTRPDRVTLTLGEPRPAASPSP